MAERRAAGTARLLAFVMMYAALQAAWAVLREGPAGLWFVEQATVQTSAALIDLVFPDHGVHAVGPRLVWPGGRLQLLAGCDGMDIVMLFVPAALLAPVAWRRGLFMLGAGLALIWALNQLRLLALYASFRHWRESFDALHTVWGPLAMLTLVAAFFAWNLHARDG